MRLAEHHLADKTGAVNMRDAQALADAIDELLAEREAQVVQREREAARGLEAEVMAKFERVYRVLRNATDLLSEDGTEAKAKAVLENVLGDCCPVAMRQSFATYNDNRKG